jgi:hypothetical protein
VRNINAGKTPILTRSQRSANHTSAADLKSPTHSPQNPVQGLQIESGAGIMELLVPITFRSPRKGLAAMLRGLRKVALDASLSLTSVA